MDRRCFRCGAEVIPETDEDLRKEYPYYCPVCDENMYEFETKGGNSMDSPTKTRTYKRGKLTITVTSNEPSPEAIKRFNKKFNQMIYESHHKNQVERMKSYDGLGCTD